MRLHFKKLNPKAVLPTQAHATDAGLDLTATSGRFDPTNQVWEYGCGLAVEIPEGYVGLLFPRSSVYRTGMVMSNCVGVIDSGYRGEIIAKFYAPTPDITQPYDLGERFAQIVIVSIPRIETCLVDRLSDSDRGEGGYGSTGR